MKWYWVLKNRLIISACAELLALGVARGQPTTRYARVGGRIISDEEAAPMIQAGSGTGSSDTSTGLTTDIWTIPKSRTTKQLRHFRTSGRPFFTRNTLKMT